jgi:hypothetical protein
MKISADSLLGSARKINNNKKLEETSPDRSKKGMGSDSIDITRKINSRIESIEKEVKEIQTSLSKNQIMRNGLDLIESKGSFGEKSSEILNNTTFEGTQLLKEYLAGVVTSESVAEGKKNIAQLINDDINRLTRVQVEVDNIIASDLAAGKKPENLLADINAIFGERGTNAENFSNLNADKVMQLIK